MPLPIPESSSVLLLRTDAIGDNVIFSAMLPNLVARFGNATFSLVCQEHIAPLYQHCPLIKNVIPFTRAKAVSDPGYLDQLMNQLRQTRPDLCLYTVYSREAIGDELAFGSKAATTVAFRGNSDNISAEALALNNAHYTHLIDTFSEWSKPEIDRYRDFLAALGANPELPATQIWSSPADQQSALQLIQHSGIDPARMIALFAAGQFAYKNFPRFGKALAQICREQDLHVVAMGSEGDFEVNQSCLNDISTPSANLCGQTTLLQSAEVLRAARVSVGTDTGLAHVACAVGTQNIIVLGGGHFGRFLPYSPRTSIVTLPLECFGCNWRCRYLWPHCVKDVAPEVVELAVREALAARSDKTRVYFQDRSLWTRPPAGPIWSPRGDLLPQQLVQINLATDSTVTRKFRQPFFGPWIKGMTKALLRPIARAFR